MHKHPAAAAASHRTARAGALGRAVAAVALSAAAASAGAAGDRAITFEGGYFVDAALSNEYLYTSNFFYQPDQARGVGGYLLKPEVHIGRDMPDAQIILSGRGNLAWYDISDVQSYYADQQYDARGHWQITDRSLFAAFATRDYNHDPIGTRRTEILSNPQTDADEWRLDRYGGSYRFGAENALFNVEAAGGYDDKHYVTNTALTAYQDYRIARGSSTLFYNYSPKTAALVDVRYAKTEFYDSSALPNADESGVRLGLRWQAAAKTRGDVRLGYAVRHFDNSPVEDKNLFDWIAAITWTPRPTSTVVLDAKRYSEESYLTSTAVISDQAVSLNWTQRWTTRLQSSLSGEYIDADFVGSARRDHLTTFGPTLSYDALRFLQLYASFSRQIRSSNQGGVDYRTDISTVGFKLTP